MISIEELTGYALGMIIGVLALIFIGLNAQQIAGAVTFALISIVLLEVLEKGKKS